VLLHHRVQYPPLPIGIFERSSPIVALAKRHASDGGELLVDLNGGFELDTDAVYAIVSSLTEASAGVAAGRSREFVKHSEMCAMRAVCDALGIRFDRWVRPRFATLGESEICTYALRRYGATGSLRFVNGRAHLRYASERLRVEGRFAYDVGARGMRLRHGIPLRLEPDGADFLLYVGEHAPRIERFANTTPERRTAPPAVPAYADDEWCKTEAEWSEKK